MRTRFVAGAEAREEVVHGRKFVPKMECPPPRRAAEWIKTLAVGHGAGSPHETASPCPFRRALKAFPAHRRESSPAGTNGRRYPCPDRPMTSRRGWRCH